MKNLMSLGVEIIVMVSSDLRKLLKPSHETTSKDLYLLSVQNLG